jgi:hypothetical protein
LIRNIFFVGQYFKFVKHLSRQPERDGFHRSFDPGVELDFDPVRLRKIEILSGIVRILKVPLVLFFSEFWHRPNFLLHKAPSRLCS